jgi:urea carboxylase-associated protein 2
MHDQGRSAPPDPADTPTTTTPITSTTVGARTHARAQSGTVTEHMVTVPAPDCTWAPAGIDVASLVWAERIAGGGYSARVLAAGTTVRLTDVEGEACAHLLVFRADDPWERLCVADTVKVQWQAYTGAGQLLLSDQGRVLASVVADTSGHHDALCGTTSRARNELRYGDGSPQGPTPAGRELFVLAGAKHGLGPRDLPPSLSLFKGVRVEPDGGRLDWMGAAPAAPTWVELRAEVPLVLLVANTAHPLDPRPEWICGTLEVLAWPGQPTAPGAWPWDVTPEGARAFANTADDRVARAGGRRR